MTAYCLLTGELAKPPEQRTGQTGKPFVLAALRCQSDGESFFANLIAFDDSAMDALLKAKPGDPLAVQGRVKPSAWLKAGADTPNASLSVTVGAVLTIRPKPRPKTTEGKSGPTASPGVQEDAFDGGQPFDDPIPFPD